MVESEAPKIRSYSNERGTKCVSHKNPIQVFFRKNIGHDFLFTSRKVKHAILEGGMATVWNLPIDIRDSESSWFVPTQRAHGLTPEGATYFFKIVSIQNFWLQVKKQNGRFLRGEWQQQLMETTYCYPQWGGFMIWLTQWTYVPPNLNNSFSHNCFYLVFVVFFWVFRWRNVNSLETTDRYPRQGGFTPTWAT